MTTRPGLVLGLLAAWSLGLSSCLGTAGGETFEIEAFAAGPADARPGEAYSFVSGRGFDVTLTHAELWLGAVYLNRSVATSVASDTSCILAGIYVTEVTEGRFVDVLSPELQAFPRSGTTTTDAATTAEIWLSGGDIDAENDPTVIFDVAGIARRAGMELPFEGRVTIGANRKDPATDPALPGANPICKDRVVSPIPVRLTAQEGDDLVIRVDPRGIFANVDFEALEQIASDPPLYRFRDDDSDQPSRNLLSGLRAGVGTYDVNWVRP